MKITFDIFKDLRLFHDKDGNLNLPVDYSPFIKMIVDSTLKFSQLRDISPEGILIRSYKDRSGREFELRINGDFSIKTADGRDVYEPSHFVEYYNLKRESELKFETIPWLKLIETENPMAYHGVFYSLKDAEYYIQSGDMFINV